jgi:rhodanese-related sulfurtransferase/predicted transcriptional regulator
MEEHSHRAKSALFDAIAEVAAALAAGRRAEIVDILAQGERMVEQVAQEIQQSVANTSHHLGALHRAGLVSRRRQGARVLYRLAGPEVEELWVALRGVAAGARDDFAHLAVAYLGKLDALEVVSRRELLRLQADGQVTVIDVRPREEYRQGHVPGALSVPLPELHHFPPPGGRPVVAYCRGPYCAFAPAAVRQLRSRGLPARRLEEGFPEWRRAGLPVAAGDEVGAAPPGGMAGGPFRP